MTSDVENTERPFEEQLTGLFAPDVVRFGLPVLLVAGVFWGLGWTVAWALATALGLFVVAFFRNPQRTIPEGEHRVVSPADGRVLEVGEIEGPDGEKRLRIGIFLSVFNVHVNRAPVAGRVVAVERSGSKFLAAFNRDAETLNVRSTMTLETRGGARIDVAQITGLIARRIICHAEPGHVLERGVRYGLIRFGSRTDVVLPLGSTASVAPGDTVRGGSTVIAELPEGLA